MLCGPRVHGRSLRRPGPVRDVPSSDIGEDGEPYAMRSTRSTSNFLAAGSTRWATFCSRSSSIEPTLVSLARSRSPMDRGAWRHRARVASMP